ncbi:GL20139 [Drosophila persimilis]|uniref:GL20139 n=1 Tax=Drosophila persimilis TaxID=7234 RepID=B4IS76_DROPE|nr:GL20139 [Drosophila persimilis]
MDLMPANDILPLNTTDSATSTFNGSIESGIRQELVLFYALILGATLIVYLILTFGFFKKRLPISLHLHDRAVPRHHPCLDVLLHHKFFQPSIEFYSLMLFPLWIRTCLTTYDGLFVFLSLMVSGGVVY